jgi:hypothetical protein
MPQPDIRRELRNAPVEPLLPIEKKLIGWSLGIGLVLLVLLVLVNHYAPVSGLTVDPGMTAPGNKQPANDVRGDGSFRRS